LVFKGINTFKKLLTNQKYSIKNHPPMKSFFHGLICLFLMLGTVPAIAQIGIGTKTPAPSAALEVTSSTNNKGILIPRVTATQKDAIASPAQGLLVYQTTAPIGFYYYTGTSWKLMAIQTDIASKVDKVDGKDLSSNDYTTAEKTKLAAITGTNTGDQTTITGNAGTATKLASPRTINGVAFDGTANITVTADAGTLTGSFTKDITVNSVNIGRGNGENGSNTRIGSQALNSNTLGYRNVAIGDASLSNNTTGGRNNAIGSNALFKNTTGSENTAIGTSALENNTNGNRNLAIGQQTLFTNTEGVKNVALGYIPLYSNTTGSNNNAIGDETLFYNTTGNYNIGIGSQAGLTISTGSQNTMIGAQADVASGALTNATALGFRAKVSASNTIQLGNTNVTNVKTSGTITAGAVTYPKTDGSNGQVLTTNGAGVPTWTTPAAGGVPYNGATGAVNLGAYDLMVNDITIGRGAGVASGNTAIGNGSLRSNTGADNTAIGYYSLYSNTTGYENSANGNFSLFNNTIGIRNTANGTGSLRSNLNGSFNAAFGLSALYSNTTGSDNTAIGSGAGYANTTGSNNTFIGRDAAGSSVTASNTITLGNSFITTLRAQVTSITSLSDQRDKTDISTISEGLDFLKQLKPVSFTWNTRDKAKVGIKSAGFIAQDLLALQQKSAIGDNLDLVSQGNPDKLEARYSNLLPVIVKAIQEESAQKDAEIAALKASYQAQQKQIEELKLLIMSMKK
jgi:hypothetical protein